VRGQHLLGIAGRGPVDWLEVRLFEQRARRAMGQVEPGVPDDGDVPRLRQWQLLSLRSFRQLGAGDPAGWLVQRCDLDPRAEPDRAFSECFHQVDHNRLADLRAYLARREPVGHFLRRLHSGRTGNLPGAGRGDRHRSAFQHH